MTGKHNRRSRGWSPKPFVERGNTNYFGLHTRRERGVGKPSITKTIIINSQNTTTENKLLLFRMFLILC